MINPFLAIFGLWILFRLGGVAIRVVYSVACDLLAVVNAVLDWLCAAIETGQSRRHAP